MQLSVYLFVDAFCLVPEIAKYFELSPRIMDQIAFNSVNFSIFILDMIIYNKISLINSVGGRDSVVGIATCYRLVFPEMKSQ